MGKDSSQEQRMHRIRIPDHALRLSRQRGTPATSLEDVDPLRCALLVIDMQNAFVAPGGALEIVYAREIVPAINRLADVFRQRGATVCWIRTDFRGQADAWSNWFGRRLDPDAAAVMIENLSQGHPGYELFPALSVASTDMFSTKTRFSAFIQGASDLDEVLRGRGLDTVVVTGTVSNICCESTARDAMMLNYRTVFVSDANAARTDEEHNATLGNMVQCFADVASTDALLQQLNRRS
ncbi:isochorismatase family protein [Burkholderia cepacia]|uniref:isochorismatase family protein n=1 Tax=Burkholderia cepacia TaxID=292 RepID=UPI0013F3C24B|nr:cysteine hydrolase [Burkholderia cepacia]NHB08395.1 cysteine hydrolase [Burkholderia cepacia]UQO36866.1 cysteine hydrolase [Burkholderia cepacia]UQO51193.1 cysteine hydrolase [Burkholderia cepacia]UQP05351.1 cysteine hydrolase [Burkholderia cepacia]